MVNYCLVTPIHLFETLSELWLQPETLPTQSFLPFFISQVLGLSDSLEGSNCLLVFPLDLYCAGAFPNKSFPYLIPPWCLRLGGPGVLY